MGDTEPIPHSREAQVALIEELTSTVLSTLDLPTVLARSAKLLRRHFGDTRITITRLLEGSPEEAEVILADDPRVHGSEVGTRFALAGTACGEAVRTRERVIVEPIDAARPRWREERLLGAYGYGSVALFPLRFESQILGTLEIAHPARSGLLACCLKSAEQVARLIAIALHNVLQAEEIRRLNRLLDRENALLREELRQIRREVRYVAESPRMKQVLERVRLVAPSGSSVLIRGETGTGKEGLARLVHDFSPRFGKPFVVVNLGAMPDTLIESELFGHEKGAFTGALRRKPGRFEQAEGGTIFLDEVGDAPMAVQVRLLRVLQEREVQPVGGTDSVKVDVRVVAATNRPLEEMVAAGSFREDLYYRLNVFPVHLPPLRERPEEIRPLVECFLARQAATMHRKPPAVSEAAWRTLEAHPWPGNVRELENVVQRALILSPGAELALPELAAVPASLRREVLGKGAPLCWDDEVRGVLQRALEACGGRIYGPAGAASLLGLKPTTLQGKLRKYGLTAAGRSGVERGCASDG